MENQRYQKIQNLVKAAGILSAAEKGEWVELMELMNDRQLLELEKILGTADQRGSAAARINTENNRISSVAPKPGVQQSVISQKISRPELPGVNLAELPKPLAVPKPPEPKPKTQAPVLPSNLPIANEVEPGPSFKHILNFPKTMGLEAGKDLLSKTFGPKVESSPVQAPKRESPFLSKLKAIFAEKELLPGVLPKASPVKPPVPIAPIKKIELPPAIKKPVSPKHHEKKAERDNITINLNISSAADLSKVPGMEKVGQELSEALGKAKVNESVSQPSLTTQAPVSPLPASPVRSVVLESKPESKLVVLELKSETKPPSPAQTGESAPAGNLTNTKTQNLIIQTERVSISPMIAKTAQADRDFRVDSNDIPVQSLPKKQAQTKKNNENENVAPGLNFFEASVKPSQGDQPLAGYGSARPELAKRSAKIILLEKSGDDMKLETLSDAAGLSVADLKQHAAGTFFRKLQRLVAQNGRHEVVFNLEKSPLYKSYVNTGVQLLKDQTNFEKIPGQAGDGQQLDRNDFEQFADLLIVMGSKA